jgi:hypothetical protein
VTKLNGKWLILEIKPCNLIPQVCLFSYKQHTITILIELVEKSDFYGNFFIHNGVFVPDVFTISYANWF